MTANNKNQNTIQSFTQGSPVYFSRITYSWYSVTEQDIYPQTCKSRLDKRVFFFLLFTFMESKEKWNLFVISTRILFTEGGKENHEKGRNDMPANKWHIHLITICILYLTHLATGSSLSQVTLYHLGLETALQLKLNNISIIRESHYKGKSTKNDGKRKLNIKTVFEKAG